MWWVTFKQTAFLVFSMMTSGPLTPGSQNGESLQRMAVWSGLSTSLPPSFLLPFRRWLQCNIHWQVRRYRSHYLTVWIFFFPCCSYNVPPNAYAMFQLWGVWAPSQVLSDRAPDEQNRKTKSEDEVSEEKIRWSLPGAWSFSRDKMGGPEWLPVHETKM